MTHIGMRVYLRAMGMFISSLLMRSIASREKARPKDTSYFDPY
jgi:hypothetical protein